jgi:hypothetical protein
MSAAAQRMAMQTSPQEVIDTFAVTSRARALLRQWRSDHAHPQVPRIVMRHVTKALYELQPSAVEAACTRSEHPLGDIRKQTAMAVRPVVDWRPDFAFTHVMHFAMEKLGRLPTFQDFTDYCARDPLGRAALGGPARDIRRWACAQGYAAGQVSQAIKWRIGLAYYSFAREVYTIAVLRGAGLDVRAHPLADALFRADAWIGRTVVNIYIRNPRFRDGNRGRKPRSAQILAGATPPFHHEELRLEARHEFGCVHLPEASQIHAIAQRLQTGSHAL